MKYCETYAVALSALIDGELSDTERAEVLAHLEICQGCRDYFAELTVMHANLGGMEEFDVPEGFVDGVMARLHEAPAAKKRTPRAAWLSLAACAAIVVFAVGGPLRGQFNAKLASGSAAPEAAVLTMDEPTEDCAEEEYVDNYACVQSAPRTMMLDGIAQEANDFDAGEAPAENGMAEIDEKSPPANDALFANEAQLPRSVVFVYGAAHEDYLIELATSFDYYADGTVAGYDLPVEKLDEFLALLDADGLTYDSSVAKQATTFYVQYEEGNTNG